MATEEKRRHRERKGLSVNPQRGPYNKPRVIYETRVKRINELSKIINKRNHKTRGDPLSVRNQAKALGFRSGFERTLDIQLKRSGIDYKYEPIKINYTLNLEYVPDFVLDNGIIIEAKGVLNKYDDKECTKMVHARDQHPELDIRFVFQNAHAKIPRRKSTHAEWATRNGFLWADGKIPDEWLT